MRRQSREWALQLLYQIEMAQTGFNDVETEFWSRQKTEDPATVDFARQLVSGVLAQKEEIDTLIAKQATHWKLSRMPVVDRNVLRLAVYELKSCLDIPIKVTLNEAIEVAKKFGAEESHTFINGVLDKIAKLLRKEEIL